MDSKEIKELIETLGQSNLTEINIKDNKSSVINLKREKGAEIVTPRVTQQPTQPINHTRNETQQKPSHSSRDEQSNDNEYNTINTPMVGTFYKSPSPDEKTYVQIGDKVTNKSTVYILEAMKSFNEIQAETTGEIVEILVGDGQMVEYGRPLFKAK